MYLAMGVVARALAGSLLALLVAAPSPMAAGRARPTNSALPPSALAVPAGDGWHEWWRASRAPLRWSAPLPAVADAVTWRPLQPGLEWGELRLAGSGEAWRLRVIVARLDPRRFTFAVHADVDASGMAGPWSVKVAPAGAALALDAGQFDASGPWGWVVHQGIEIRPPGAGPLAPAFAVDTAGRVRLVPPDSIAIVRRAGGVVEAFQSYPMLLVGDGEVPRQLADTGRGVDLLHRDSRLALGVLRDGRILVALTRFEGLGGVLEQLPFGPTVPEMAAIMGALGCRSAVLLDGGISGQLLVRDHAGEVHEWLGMRDVPLGFIAVPRIEPRHAR
jgi:hypothetical protein